ncbi:MAG: magnesium transporter MgtC [Desulfuromonas sp.]|nr:MAG: magnesium transporter MgtC [Desulfuromonas sp.]
MEWLDPFYTDYSELAIAFKLLLAALLGGLIGFEREVHGRPAGFRTHLLVTLGACLMIIVSEVYYFKYANLASDSVLRLDPARIAAQIVSGIGFLGAGAIIKEGHAVRGLTTAACLWVSAGIGMAVGAGFYFPALVVTGIALFSLLLLKRVEKKIRKERYRSLRVHCAYDEKCLPVLEQFLEERRLRIVNFGFEKDRKEGEIVYNFVIAQSGPDVRNKLVRDFMSLKQVYKVRFY